MKKMTAFIMTLVLLSLLVLPIAGHTVYAVDGSISSLPVSIKAYPVSTANNTPAFASKGDSKKSGTIYASDLCTITRIDSDGWLYVTYPTSNNRTRSLFVRAQDFFCSTSFQKASVIKYATAYRRSSGDASLGSVDSTDKLVYVIGSPQNNRVQIVYKVTNSNYYKMGWVSTDALNKTSSSTPSISIQGHVQDIGWMGIVTSGVGISSTVGTTGRSLRLEDLKLRLNNASGGIKISSHVACIGWLGFSSAASGRWAESGTTGRSLAIEAVKIELYGAVANSYDILYKIHSQDIGWGDWCKNGQVAGTTGRSLRAEAIEIKLVAKSKMTPTTYYVKTNGSNLIVRSAPSGTAIGKLANGTAVSVYSINNGWAQIQYGSGTGYISSSYITKEEPKPSEWQWPMTNAQCSWTSYGSTWSWGEHKTGGSGGRNYHLGLDLKGSDGNVYAAADGKVVACSSSYNGANGRYIIIEHNLNGKTVYSFYAHLSRVDVSKGKYVSKGTLIGIYGGSGKNKENYYGPHLHFAVMDTLWESGGYWGYANQGDFSGNTARYDNVTYYNPKYIIANGCLP